MKIGIAPINVGGPETAERMIETVQYAESAGIESVWTFEHVIVPTEYDSVYQRPDALLAFEDLGIERAVAFLSWAGQSDPRQAIDVIASHAGL